MTQQLTVKQREKLGPLFRSAVESWESRGYTVSTLGSSTDEEVNDLYIKSEAVDFRLLSNGVVVAYKPFYQSRHFSVRQPDTRQRMIDTANDWLKIVEDPQVLMNVKLLLDIIQRIHDAPLTYKMAAATKEIEQLNDAADAICEIAVREKTI
ncbi:hypothetical protein CIG75_19185 [Tumebacillus algifaecis]|uniref:Uncharacterized protein n=1 Tax=Tumebacillus algifaecis TaxID=1214604 RepID=A0A223D5I7_9BACL|nr:hypothetical protein [Tumebacillus algifaecis]ASS76858.1 hypothetical protein CIG75_19185 [Tumebacillus algifaecis]